MKFFAKKGRKFVFKVIILFIIGFALFLFVDQNIKIRTKREELAKMKEQIASEKAKEEEIRQRINEVENSENSGDNKIKRRVFENAVE